MSYISVHKGFNIKKTTFLIVIYLLLSLTFFCLIALPVLNSRFNFQFYADSKTYEKAAIYNTEKDLVHVSGNFLGPVMILKFLGPTNYWGIFIFNICIFILSIYLLLSNKFLNKIKFLLLLMISPITFTSLFSINKEIISLLCIALIIKYINEKKLYLVLLALILSYLVRWQFSLFVLVYILIESNLNIIRNNRFLIIIILLVFISIVIDITSKSLLVGVFDIYTRTSSTYTEGLGLFNLFMYIQIQYGYIFAFVFKLIHLLIGMISRYSMIFDFKDVYNNLILFLQAVLNFILILSLINRKQLSLKYDIFYVLLIYCIVFSITPIYAIRYFYPVYIFLAYLISFPVQSKILVIKR